MLQLWFKRHRFPPEIIRHSIWLYTWFTLRFRDVEEMLVGIMPACTAKWRQVEPSLTSFSRIPI